MRKYPSQPWVAIGVVVHKDEDVLLIKRGKEPNFGKWSIPGGAQKLGETLFEGCVREVLEETCIQINTKHFIDAVDSIHFDEQGLIEYHYTILEVSAIWVSGTPSAQDDALEACWVPITDIQDLGMSPETIRIIRSSYNSLNI